MRRKGITEDYAAGVLENLGGFYVFHNKKRNDLHPRFKLVCGSEDKVNLMEDVAKYLKKEHKIIMRIYGENNNLVFAIAQLDSLSNLIKFLEKNCRLKKNDQDYVKQILNRRDKVIGLAQKNRLKEIERLKELKE